MKFLVSLLVVFSVCQVIRADLTQEQKDKIQEHHKLCIQETGVDPDLVAKARQGDFANDEKLKKHIFCVTKKMGFQNDKGEIQNSVLEQKVGLAIGDQAKAKTLIDECAKPLASGEETAFETIKCYFNKIHVSVI